MVSIKQRIGETILILQKVEALLRASLYVVGAGDTTDSKLVKLLHRDHKTMGMLFNGMKSHIELPEDFSTTLDNLLRDRNMLVHELFLQDWYDLRSESALRRINSFLDQILTNASIAVRVIISFVLFTGQEKFAINSLSVKHQKEYKIIINRIFISADPDFGDKTPDEYLKAFTDQICREFLTKIKPKC